jgi:hypothetical protein
MYRFYFPILANKMKHITESIFSLREIPSLQVRFGSKNNCEKFASLHLTLWWGMAKLTRNSANNKLSDFPSTLSFHLYAHNLCFIELVASDKIYFYVLFHSRTHTHTYMHE